ncbi:sulfotransferase domain-containing protein [Paenibacillus alkalitolerans]|uniref:sulfotransferase domain-containing protein n=1 Tax=Paenibacillus alkalitolerans TaxID=2799335 RepID=UPI0018F38894|nr:sulfotransferase domain-containing protein [Paenibacillus alkalitolerans]
MTSVLPKVLAIGIPCSGINLLSQIVVGNPLLTEGLWVNQWYEDSEDMYKDLKETKPGEVRFGHLYYTSQLKIYLNENDFRRFFIYRDPRDSIVSYLFHVTALEKTHAHHKYFVNALKDDEDRLMKLITGFAESKDIAAQYGLEELGYGNVTHHFLPYLRWLEDPGTCAVRYEDLVNGGETRRKQIIRMIDYLWDRIGGAGLDKEILASAMEKNLYPGMSGQWKQYFNEEHKYVFKELAGDLLIYLGYEDDTDW